MSLLRCQGLALLAVCSLSLSLGTPALAALVLNDLSGYSTNFDHLDNASSTNAWTDNQAGPANSSGSPGWYWQDGGPFFMYDAGGAGSAGAFSHGLHSSLPGSFDRAMGSFNEPSKPNIAWGIVFQNNSGQAISEVQVSYQGEQWRRAESSADPLNFSFISSPTNITDMVPSQGPLPPGWTAETSLHLDAPLAPGSPPFFDPSAVANETPVSGTFAVSVPVGGYLALRWHDGDVVDNDAALGIDDLTVNFTAVPEPSAFLFGSVVCGCLAIAKRFKKRGQRA